MIKIESANCFFDDRIVDFGWPRAALSFAQDNSGWAPHANSSRGSQDSIAESGIVPKRSHGFILPKLGRCIIIDADAE